MSAAALTPSVSVGGLALLHRRLAIGMALAGVLAFSAGVGLETLSPVAAALLLLFALVRRASPRLSTRIEQLALPVAFLLMVRAVYSIVAGDGDVIVPVVDVLLVLMCAEGLRSLDAFNDIRLYGLSFALLLASTAYRPGAAFALAFVAYVALAAPALTLGHLRRNLGRHGAPDVALGRAMLLTVGALTGVSLLAAVLVFFAFPRTSQGWVVGSDLPTMPVAGFSDVVSIGEFGARIRGNPQIVLRVEFPQGRPSAGTPLHWRGRSYDRFDGVRWSRSSRLRAPSGGRVANRLGTVEQRIYAAPLESRVLFGLHRMIRVETDGPIQPLTDQVGDYYYWGPGSPVYTAYSVPGRPSDDRLRAAEGGLQLDVASYLQLPDALPERVRLLADSLTRGLDTRFDRVQRIERWLLEEFSYTLDLPRTAREATLEHFLFERRSGHCEYFSTAMVVLLRSIGIEARNVNGFLGGSWNEFGGYLAVTQNEAHSWVEVWFPGHGWVTFDPTPAGAGGAGAANAWFWPGRFFLDAVQHRWSRWVLDYGPEQQSEALSLALSAFQAEEGIGAADPGPPGGGPTRGRWLLLAGLLLAAGGALSLRRGARIRAVAPETRTYLRLVDSCRRAGLVEGSVAPLELVERVRQGGGAAAAPASRLVELYIRARFAGEPLRREEHSEMTRALEGARRALARGAGSPDDENPEAIR